MTNIFNSTFEISLRALLLLSVAPNRKQTLDKIAAIDFITVYGKDFGISNENLHGDNNFKFSEFALRRNLVDKSIRELVLKGLVDIFCVKNGFLYTISSQGLEYCQKFENDYANTYRILAKQTLEFVNKKSERTVLKIINKYSVYSIKRGEISG